MTSTERFLRRLRLVPYPPRAAELEEQFLQLRAEAREELAAAEASGEVRGFWQRRKFMQRESAAAFPRELRQMWMLPGLWLIFLFQPWLTLVYKSYGFLVALLASTIVFPILDPFVVWIGSFIVPRGGFRLRQSMIFFVLSFVFAICVQVAFRRLFAGR